MQFDLNVLYITIHERCLNWRVGNDFVSIGYFLKWPENTHALAWTTGRKNYRCSLQVVKYACRCGNYSDRIV